MCRGHYCRSPYVKLHYMAMRSSDTPCFDNTIEIARRSMESKALLKSTKQMVVVLILVVVVSMKTIHIFYSIVTLHSMTTVRLIFLSRTLTIFMHSHINLTIYIYCLMRCHLNQFHVILAYEPINHILYVNLLQMNKIHKVMPIYKCQPE